MSTLLAFAGDLPDVLAGRPSLIVSAALPDFKVLAVEGIDLWIASFGQDGILLSRPGSMPGEGSPVPLALPPAGAIALVGANEADFADLCRWWTSAAARSIPFIIAATGAAALRPVLECLSREFHAANARAVQLERALVETRMDYEETRVVMAAVSRTLGHRPPSLLSLVLASEPGEEQIKASGTAASLTVRQRLGSKLDGIAAVAIHVAGVAASPTTGCVRVRIYGEESGRVHASWTVPLTQVELGWLALDLPTPLGPVRETALLEVVADAKLSHSFALSLESKWAPPDVGCKVEGSGPSRRALALRLWTADIGARFVVPAFWNWDEAGSSLPLGGVPQAVSAYEWNLARVLAGDFSSVALGNEPARVIVRINSSGTAALLLPAVTIAGADVMRLGCTVRASDPRKVQFGAWMIGRDVDVRTIDDLARHASRASFSGWRRFAAGNTDSLTLSIPVSFGQQAQMILGVRAEEASHDAKLEFSELSLFATRDPAKLRDQRQAAQDLLETAPEPAKQTTPLPVENVSSFGGVELHQHLVGQRGYQHLDLTVRALAGRGHQWASIRFKLGLSSDQPTLEFRRTAGWPAAFTQWPGTDVDQFGPLLRIRVTDTPRLITSLSHPKDMAMIASLLERMEDISAEGADLARLDADATQAWLDAARAFAGAGSTNPVEAQDDQAGVVTA